MTDAMWFPSNEEVIELHELILARTGGEPGILMRGSIDSAIERAKWGPFETDGGIPDRAALLLRGIAQDHPFADGNKRTALEASDLFLRRNGFSISASQAEIVRFMLEVAQGHVAIRDIAGWIRENARKL
jgi:death-on-curing protein